MAAVSMGARGTDELVGSLDTAARALAGLAPVEAGRLLAGRIVQTSPRKTGFMASRVAATVAGGVVDVVVATDYAGIVNARNPWATRALEQLTDELVTIYADEVAGIVGQIIGV